MALLFACLIGAGGCGGNPTTPAPPDAPSAPPAAPTALAVVPFQRTAAGNRYQLSWSAPADPRVTAFVVEVGTASGAADVATVDTASASTTFTLVTNVRGPAVVRVRARWSGGVTGASNEVSIEDIRDMIEALFFATGRLRSPSHQPICQFTALYPDAVEGFGPRTGVTVTVSSTMPAANRAALDRLFDDVVAATDGGLGLTRLTSSDRTLLEDAVIRRRFPGPNHVVVVDWDDSRVACGNALGCGGGTLYPNPATALFQNGFANVNRVNDVNNNSVAYVAAHETAHALGLCHLTSPIMGQLTLMGTSAVVGVTALSAAELAAIRSVYRAGFGGGTTRQQLQAAGLL